MTPRVVSDEERRARLAVRHGLAEPAGEPTSAAIARLAAELCGLHATDPATVHLAVRARNPRSTVEMVERAWYDDRVVVKALGMRRTVFVISSEWLSVMHAACTVPIEQRERKAVIALVESAGIAADGAGWLRDAQAGVVAALRSAGELTGTELAKAVPQLSARVLLNEGKAYGGESTMATRTLFLLGCAGVIVRGRPKGSWLSSQHRWALAETALGHPLVELDPDEARARLARRWLAAFGPATAKDLQWWAGWTLGATRRALAAIGAVEVVLADGSPAFVNADDLDPVGPVGRWVALLPSLDPTAMGWNERAWYLGPHRAELFDYSGNIGPTVWCDGRIVGGWAVRRDGDVVTRLLEPIDRTAQRLLDREVAALTTWLDGTVVSPRFATPIDKALRA